LGLAKRTGWWFQIFFIFTPSWGRLPFCLIFFRWVETTNQSICASYYTPTKTCLFFEAPLGEDLDGRLFEIKNHTPSSFQKGFNHLGGWWSISLVGPYLAQNQHTN